MEAIPPSAGAAGRPGNPARIVILGGGGGGLAAAIQLERLSGRGTAAEVTLGSRGRR